MDIQTQVLSVQGKTFTRKSGAQAGTQGIRYEVALADGQTYTTFDADKATRAQSLIGQAVDARVSSKQNGDYTNLTLEDIAPSGQLPALVTPDAGTVPIVGAQQTTIPVSNGQALPVAFSQGEDPTKQQNIVKQVAFKVAGGVVAGLFEGAGPEAADQAFEELDKRARAIYERFYPAPAAQPSPTPEAVAAAVNADAGANVVAVGAGTPEW